MAHGIRSISFDFLWLVAIVCETRNYQTCRIFGIGLSGHVWDSSSLFSINNEVIVLVVYRIVVKDIREERRRYPLLEVSKLSSESNTQVTSADDDGESVMYHNRPPNSSSSWATRTPYSGGSTQFPMSFDIGRKVSFSKGTLKRWSHSSPDPHRKRRMVLIFLVRVWPYNMEEVLDCNSILQTSGTKFYVRNENMSRFREPCSGLWAALLQRLDQSLIRNSLRNCSTHEIAYYSDFIMTYGTFNFGSST